MLHHKHYLGSLSPPTDNRIIDINVYYLLQITCNHNVEAMWTRSGCPPLSLRHDGWEFGKNIVYHFPNKIYQNMLRISLTKKMLMKRLTRVAIPNLDLHPWRFIWHNNVSLPKIKIIPLCLKRWKWIFKSSLESYQYQTQIAVRNKYKLGHK